MVEVEQVKPEPATSEVPDIKVIPRLQTPPRPLSSRPVRAPLRIVWREVRFRFLPMAAFILAGLFSIFLWRQWVLVESSPVPASTFAQEPGLLQNGPAIADRESVSIAPLQSASAHN
jgi:hypothetical protein